MVPHGLRDHPRAPYTPSIRTSAQVERAILCVRKTYPTWGSKKILAKLEPFHETLKAETAMPTRAMIGARQAAIAGLQTIYNEDRPHEARGMKVPAEFYDFSPRCTPDKLPE